MRKVRKDLGKGFNDFDCNPVGKARIIADAMTGDTYRQTEIFSKICEILTGDEINEFYKLITIKSKQLKLWEQDH
tara:strand:+ start:251 stop:475 length:225 start_codon:yes stop_codon:yes gene_type:complete